MNGITYGYIRVSSKDQNEDRQCVAMHDAGVNKRHIFMDKQSGKDFDRPGWRRVLRKLKAGDTLIVKSIDRLGHGKSIYFYLCKNSTETANNHSACFATVKCWTDIPCQIVPETSKSTVLENCKK